MGDTVKVMRGSTLRLRFSLWEGKRHASERVDLSGATIDLDPSIKPIPLPAFMTDPTEGRITAYWTKDQTRLFKQGRVNRFRLRITTAGGDTQLTNDIWIEGQ